VVSRFVSAVSGLEFIVGWFGFIVSALFVITVGPHGFVVVLWCVLFAVYFRRVFAVGPMFQSVMGVVSEAHVLWWWGNSLGQVVLVVVVRCCDGVVGWVSWMKSRVVGTVGMESKRFL